MLHHTKRHHKTHNPHRPRRKATWWLIPLLSLTCLGWLLCGAPTQALAQENGTAFQLQRFRPWADPQGQFQTLSGQSMGQWQYRLGFYANYAKDPLILRSIDDSRAGSIIGHQLGADFIAGIGLLSFLDVSLSLPMTLYQSGSILDSALFDPSLRGRDLSGFALSDLKLSVKLQALRHQKHFFDMAIQFEFGFPVGNDTKLNGEDGLTFAANLLLSKPGQVLDFGFNFGYRYVTPTRFLNLVIENELSYSLGTSIHVMPETLDAIVEFSGFTALTNEISLDNVPLDLYAGVRWFPLGYKDLAVNLGASFGLFPGYGSPQFRVLLGVVWAPKDRDYDGDGILNAKDKCPRTPGPRANRGCPWPDTDGDGLNDNVDLCPAVPGPKENKGCPWPDTDGDGLNDKVDKCPRKAGPKENQGCPWADRDGDGLNDREDKCPDVPGVKSRKGCPKVILVKVTPREIRILQRIQFRLNSARLRRSAKPILQQVISVLRSRPKLRVEIQGHTDTTGTKAYNLKLSQRRAITVRWYLVRYGKINIKRLRVKGYGKSKPLYPNRSRRGRRLNRRVQFRILTR